MNDYEDRFYEGRYGDWSSEVDGELRQLEEVVPKLWDKLSKEGGPRYVVAENCLHMLEAIMYVRNNDHDAWAEFLSRLRAVADTTFSCPPDEFEATFNAIGIAIDTGGNISEPLGQDARQPVPITVTTTKFKLPFGNQEDSQRAAEIIRAARTNT